MSFRDTVNRVNDLTLKITEKLAFIAPLATRIVIGLAFFQAGTGKFRHFENVIGFFDGLGIPFPAFNAGLVASMETVGGVMLILGLFTRFFASGLAITMVVALMTADTADFLASWGSAAEKAPTDIAAFVFLLFLLWLIFYGAGKLSLDALLRRTLKFEPAATGSLSPDSP
ncbi:MAG: DoxX family protein [Acidobacteriota bacterium]|nr:DoxX family protein [Acidobacteriota bacterium]